MIQFFRKIRRNLLAEGNMGKYLKYAIGEIVLVVIGILIALQINNWNTSLQLEKEEQSSLEKLHQESEDIVTNLIKAIQFKTDIIVNMDKVAKAFQQKNIDDISKETLTNGIDGLGFYPAIKLPNSVYLELNSSGKLQILKSEKVRKSISDFYSEVEFINSQLIYFRNSTRALEMNMHTAPYRFVYDSLSSKKNRMEIDFDALMVNDLFKSRHVHGLRNQIVFRKYIVDLFYKAETMCASIAAELKTDCEHKSLPEP